MARRERTQYEINAVDRTRAAIRTASDGFRGLDDVVGRLGINFSIMGAIGAAAPGLIISQQAPLIEQMGALSRSLGTSIEGFQVFNKAARDAGISMEELYGSTEEALLRISEAVNLGTGEAAEGLKLLGLSAEEMGDMMPEDRIYAVLEALEEVSDAGDKIFLADKIFGGGGIAMSRILTENIDSAKESVERLGLALTEVDISAVTTMNSEFDQLMSLGDDVAKVLTSEMAPALTAVLRETLGMGLGFLDARSAGTAMADSLVKVVGFVGDKIDDVRRGVRGMEFGFQAAGVAILETFDKLPGMDLTSKIEEEQAKADVIFGKLNEIRAPGEFSEGLREGLAAARAEAEALAAKMQEARDNADGRRTGVTVPKDDDGKKGGKEGGPKLFNTTAEEIEKQIDAQIKAELAAEATLEEARRQRREDFRTLRDPLSSSSDGTDIGDLEERLTRERDVIAEQYEEKRALLSELAANDALIAQDQSAIEQEIFRDKERALTQLAVDGARDRTQLQRDAVFGLFNIAANGTAALIKNEERAKKFQQNISKARALMAGVEAAEKARAFGSTLGGVVGGSIAYGLSWGATLASVAAIDRAASGGSGSPAAASAGGGGSVSGGNSALIQNTASGGSTVYNITVLTADEIIDQEKFKQKAAQAIADATNDSTLLSRDGDPARYVMNVA